MKSSDRNFVPETFNVVNSYSHSRVESGQFYKLRFARVLTNAVITLSSVWENGDTRGMIIKSVSCAQPTSESWVIPADKKTASHIYISDILLDNPDEAYVYISNQGGTRGLIVNVEVYRGQLNSIEVVDSMPSYDSTKNNFEAYQNQILEI